MTLFQARIALIGLRFEIKTGMLMTDPRKANTYRLVATALGYPKNARPAKALLADQLEEVINAMTAEMQTA